MFPKISIVLFGIVLLAGNLSASSNEAIDQYANELAFAYIKQHPNSDDTLESYMIENEIEVEVLKTSFVESVGFARVLLDEKVLLESNYFLRLVADSRKAKKEAPENENFKYSAVAMELALKYYEDSDQELDTFYEKEGVDGTNFRTSVESFVEIGREFVALDFKPGSTHFNALLERSAKVVGGNALVASPVKPKKSKIELETKKNEEADKLIKDVHNLASDVWNIGYGEVVHMSKSQQEDLARKNGISSTELVSSLGRHSIPNVEKTLVVLTDDDGRIEKQEKLKELELEAADRLILGLAKKKIDEDKSNGTTSPLDGKSDEVVSNFNKLPLPNVIMPASFGTISDGIVRYIQFGYRKLSPYSLTESGTGDDFKIVLDEGDDETTPFFEFVYANRWAWNLERIENAKELGIDSGPMFNPIVPGFDDKGKPNRLGWLAGELWDVDFHFSYNLDSDKEQTAAAIAGSSDISMEANLGRHLFRHRYDNDSAYAVSLDLGYGLSSDRSAYDAHHRFFAGPSYTANFEAPGGGSRRALFQARLGYSKIEAVTFLNSNTREIFLTQGDLPLYELKEGVAFETDLIYPIGEDSLITLGARIYGKMDPNVWSLQIGYSRPISSFLGGLFTPVKKGDESEGELSSGEGAKSTTSKL